MIKKAFLAGSTALVLAACGGDNDGDPTPITIPPTATPVVTSTPTPTPTPTVDNPSVSFDASTLTVNEDAGTIDLGVSLSSAAQSDVTLPYTVDGTADGNDRVDLGSGSITISTGSSTGTISFTITDDADEEPDETIIVTLNTPSGADLGDPAIQTVTIAANDSADPIVQFTATSQSVDEDAGTVNLEVSANQTSDSNIVIPYTVAGTADGADSDAQNGNITINAGETSASLAIAIVDDTDEEEDETIEVTLTDPTGATLGTNQVYTLTINANDAPPSVGFTVTNQSVSEADGTATVTAELSEVVDADVTLDYSLSGTAVDSEDFTDGSDGSISITAGETTGTATINIVDDAVGEGNETVIVTIDMVTTTSNAVLGENDEQTITIGDDDALADITSFETGDISYEEGGNNEDPDVAALGASGVTTGNGITELDRALRATLTSGEFYPLMFKVDVTRYADLIVDGASFSLDVFFGTADTQDGNGVAGSYGNLALTMSSPSAFLQYDQNFQNTIGSQNSLTWEASTANGNSAFNGGVTQTLSEAVAELIAQQDAEGLPRNVVLEFFANKDGTTVGDITFDNFDFTEASAL